MDSKFEDGVCREISVRGAFVVEVSAEDVAEIESIRLLVEPSLPQAFLRPLGTWPSEEPLAAGGNKRDSAQCPTGGGYGNRHQAAFMSFDVNRTLIHGARGSAGRQRSAVRQLGTVPPACRHTEKED